MWENITQAAVMKSGEEEGKSRGGCSWWWSEFAQQVYPRAKPRPGRILFGYSLVRGKLLEAGVCVSVSVRVGIGCGIK